MAFIWVSGTDKADHNATMANMRDSTVTIWKQKKKFPNIFMSVADKYINQNVLVRSNLYS